MFGRNPTELCLIYNMIINSIQENYNHTLRNWNQPLYAKVVHSKGALLDALDW